ncbi:MAG: hypothetical protein M0Z41_05875 [Peptococcaceae bacterium]|nr:hypothetical protein [Peptococcaceae bacterium]
MENQNPFTLFLILMLLVLSSPNGGTHVDRNLDYVVNSLQAARDSIAAVRQGFQTFHTTLVRGPVAREPAWPAPLERDPSAPGA